MKILPPPPPTNLVNPAAVLPGLESKLSLPDIIVLLAVLLFLNIIYT